MSKSFIKGYVMGRCISKGVNLEVLKDEVKNIIGVQDGN